MTSLLQPDESDERFGFGANWRRYSETIDEERIAAAERSFASWLGTDGLHRLRRARERAEGAAFSLRRFHDRLLSFGAIPVPLIARVWSNSPW